MDPVLTFHVTNQIITRTDRFPVVAKSRNYLKAEFLFDTPEWEDPKTALFERDGKCWAQLLEKDACLVPYEFLDTDQGCHGQVSVFCGDLVTANKESVYIAASGYREGETPAPPSQDVYQQILETAAQAAAAAEKVREDAASGVFNGKDGETPAIGENGNWYLGGNDTGKPSQGGKGPKGPAGEAATIEIGTVTTGEPGTEAKVSNGGNSSAAVLDFVIPKGEIPKEQLEEKAPAILEEAQGTSLLLADSTEAAIKKLTMQGWTEQKKTMGAQLLDVGDFETGAVSGTTSYAWLKFKYYLTEGETYTVTNNGDISITFKISYGQGGYSSVSKSNLIGSYSFTMTTHPNTPEGSELAVFIWAANISDPDELIKIIQESNLMLNKGDTALPYEPYTGGAPSPSPDYPQEIVSAGRKTKNLFDISKIEKDSNEMIVKNGDGTITVNTSSTSSAVYSNVKLREFCPDLLVGETYTLSANTTGTDKVIRIVSNPNVEWIFGQAKTITEEMLNGTIIFYASGTNTSATISEIMVHEGDSALPYEPYGYVFEMKVTGANLLDDSQMKAQDVNLPENTRNGFEISLAPGQYTISTRQKTLGTTCYLYGIVRASDGTYGNNLHIVTNVAIYEKLVTIKEGDTLIVFDAQNHAIEVSKSLFDEYGFMINEGSTALPYEPHKSQTVTLTSDRPLTEWDKLEKRNGVWGWVYGSVIRNFDGTEGWFMSHPQALDADFFISSGIDGFSNSPILPKNGYCDKYLAATSALQVEDMQFWDKNAYFGLGMVAFRDDRFADLDEWKTYLSENPVTWMNKADEETFVALTDYEQESLNALHTNNPTTVLNNDQGCEMEIAYAADTKAYIDKRIQELIQGSITNSLLSKNSQQALSASAGTALSERITALEEKDEAL